jgi:hypothetical protein
MEHLPINKDLADCFEELFPTQSKLDFNDGLACDKNVDLAMRAEDRLPRILNSNRFRNSRSNLVLVECSLAAWSAIDR